MTKFLIDFLAFIFALTNLLVIPRFFLYHLINFNRFNFYFTEKKRRIYDQYGKEGLIDHNEGGHHHRRRGRDPFDAHDFIFGTGFPFVFRDPEDVFREFFGGNPFDDFFNITGHGSRRHPNGNAGGSRHHHRSSHPTNVMSPFLSFSLMDDMFSSPFNSIGMHHNTGFSSSLSTFNGMNGMGGGGGGGNVKRISTSTSFNNGRKVTTKK